MVFSLSNTIQANARQGHPVIE